MMRSHTHYNLRKSRIRRRSPPARGKLIPGLIFASSYVRMGAGGAVLITGELKFCVLLAFYEGGGCVQELERMLTRCKDRLHYEEELWRETLPRE